MELRGCFARVIYDKVVDVVVVYDVCNVANCRLPLSSALLHEAIRPLLSIIVTLSLSSGAQSILLVLRTKPSIIITLFSH